MTGVRNLRVRPDLFYVSSGWNVMITDVSGRITGADPQGFYARNTRVLSRERLTIDGRSPQAFSTAKVGAHAQLSYAQLIEGEALPRRGVYLIEQRFVGEGLRTRLRFESFSDIDESFQIGLELDGDFADTEEAETRLRQQYGSVARTWDPSAKRLRLDYQHPGLDLAVTFTVETDAAVSYEDNALRFQVVVRSGQAAEVDVVTEPLIDEVAYPAPPATFAEPQADNPAAKARVVLWDELATLHSTNLDVAAAWQTATNDLACLPLGESPGPAAPAAGLPIYQQVFGRDTLTAGWQSLLAGPTILRDALRLNAANIGTRVDDWRDEEPGKMIHQARLGPLSKLDYDPFTKYYGDWSTTPFFLISLSQYLAWTGDRDTIRELRPAARLALRWLERYADLDGDGFIEYECRSRRGVKNQGWKDSRIAIVDEHGQSVPNPLATSELQAYHYAALRHGAVVLAAAGDPVLAAKMWLRAARLQKRFHQAFWMPEHSSYALALGPDKRQVRSVNSNDGHLLATGIVPVSHAPLVVRRLMAPDMFSGWGVRTLSANHPAYDPFSYHRGSVWPVEAGTFAFGFARYGCWGPLYRLAEATFSAAALFEGHRLPEVISGLPRDGSYPHPGVYPESCSPQAWSAGTIMAIIQALLVLRPAAPLRAILVNPHLPPWLPDLHIEGVQLGKATFDLIVRRNRRGDIEVTTQGDRVRIIRQPTLQTMRGYP